jgi:two-component system cell cycle response regulator
VQDDQGRPTLVDIPQPQASERHCDQACLVEIYGRQIGRRLELRREELVFGRDDDCGVALDDHTVSRRHAAFRWTGRGFLVADLGSTNGTLVNHTAVRTHDLSHGDQVKIGHSIFKFLCASTTEAHYHDVIYRLMTRDGLTEAHNRQSFDQALEREAARAARYLRPLGLLMIDIDHFKTINDLYGHMAGDEVLRQLASLMARNIRQEDVFARVGGEEFALLVPEGDLTACRDAAERLRQLVETTPFEFEGRVLQVTCSFGVAELRGAEDTTGELLHKTADDRLYVAKGNGRNRVVAD